MDRSRRPLAATALVALVWTGSAEAHLGSTDAAEAGHGPERDRQDGAPRDGTWQEKSTPNGLILLCQDNTEGGEFPPDFDDSEFESPGLRSLESETAFEDFDFKDIARDGPGRFQPPLLLSPGQARAERVAAMLMDDLVAGPGGEIYFETDTMAPSLSRTRELRRARSIFDIPAASGGNRNLWRY